MIEVSATVDSAAPPAMVYRLLRASATWPLWSALGPFTRERPGQGDPDDVGAIRCFRTGIIRAREEIVLLEPDRRIDYRLLSGLPVRDSAPACPAPAGCCARWSERSSRTSAVMQPAPRRMRSATSRRSRPDLCNLEILYEISYKQPMQTLTVSETRANLKAVLDRVVADKAPIHVVRPKGEGVVLVSQSEWEGMQETMHLLSSPANAKHLLDGIKELDAGTGEERELIQA